MGNMTLAMGSQQQRLSILCGIFKNKTILCRRMHSMLKIKKPSRHFTRKDEDNVIALAYEQVKECERVYSSLKFDIRHNSTNRLENKIKSVEKRLEHEVCQ